MNMALALGYATACIHDSEGYRSAAYLDELASPPLWTIGYGTTHIQGRPVCEGMTCTETEADAWAMADVNDAAEFVQRAVKVPLTETQLGALTSLCYNIGERGFARSSVAAALNGRHYALAADRLLDYDHAGGKVVHGLTLRRRRERAMFLRGSLVVRHPSAPEPTADELNQAELDRLRH